MPAAVAIPAAISGATSIVGGLLGSSASNKAANLQQQAAQQQAQQFQQQLAQYNPAIGTTAAQAAQDVGAAAQGAGANLTGVAGQQAGNITGAAGQANALLAPYLQAGGGAATTLADLMAPGGALTKQFTAADMQTLDPGYQFRIDMANKALQASAAARGGALGGGTLQSLANLNQNLASSEMQNAFNRFQTQQQQRYSQLMGLAGVGQNAANVSGANLLNAAQQAAALQTGAAQTAGGWGIGAGEYGGTAQMNAAQQMAQNALATQRSIADLMTGGAAAKAAGTVGSANAWGGALGGVANTAQQVGRYYQERDLMDQAQQGGGGGYQSSIQAPSLPGFGFPQMPSYMNPMYNYMPYGPFASSYYSGYSGTGGPA